MSEKETKYAANFRFTKLLCNCLQFYKKQDPAKNIWTNP